MSRYQAQYPCTDPPSPELGETELIRAETLVSANARLVDFQSSLRWQDTGVAVRWPPLMVCVLYTSENGEFWPQQKILWFRARITWYNFVSDQYSGFHGIVIPERCGIPFLCWRDYLSNKRD